MAKILIVGCGRIGLPLARLLVSEGQHVAGVRRHIGPRNIAETESANRQPDYIDWYGIDVTDRNAVSSLPPDIDIMVIILTPAARSAEGYRVIYQQGVGNLLDHYGGAAVKPWCVFVSATSVYGQQDGQWVNEESDTDPLEFNGKSLLAAERAVHRFDPRSVVVRFSGIYGAERNRVLSKLKQQQYIQRTPPLYTNRIHQDDCIGALHFLINRYLDGVELQPVYLATDHDCAEKFEVMCWLARHAGLVAPLPVDRGKDAPQNKRCSNRLLLQSGYRFTYRGYRDGYAAVMDAGGYSEQK